ncbi:MAG: sigma-70 family RNA polymerase sigma factor [Gammaproteobacteria bacterium]|nr:sigma-70 family RNA polymerase sigma factor [Gammaproteobacteria bacterium]
MNRLLQLMPARKAGQLQSWSDEQLMQAYQDGQAAAFDELYGRHRASLYRYLIRLTGHQDESLNELFQEIWLKLINAREGYQPSAKFTTYLYCIAHNHLVDVWRRRRIDNEPLLDEPQDTAEVPEQRLQLQQQQQQLKQLIADLPEQQRTAFLLQQEAALSLEQIAEVTGVNRETVKSRLRYAMQRLREAVVESP